MGRAMTADPGTRAQRRRGLGLAVALLAMALAAAAVAQDEDEGAFAGAAPLGAEGDPGAGYAPGAPVQVVAAAGTGEIMVSLPSGLAVRWVETLSDAAGPAGLTLRFRFVAPEIAAPGGYDPETASTDMQALCDGFALPRLSSIGPRPAQVVIALADRLVPFGQADEAALQLFEAYSVIDGACVWELF